MKGGDQESSSDEDASIGTSPANVLSQIKANTSNVGGRREEGDEEDSEEKETHDVNLSERNSEPASRRRSTRARKTRLASLRDESSSEESESENESDDEPEDDDRSISEGNTSPSESPDNRSESSVASVVATKRKAKTQPTESEGKGQNKKLRTKKGGNEEAGRTCPHCQKVCSSKAGLKYHLDHFVCRKSLKPENQNRATATLVGKTGSVGLKAKRISKSSKSEIVSRAVDSREEAKLKDFNSDSREPDPSDPHNPHRCKRPYRAAPISQHNNKPSHSASNGSGQEKDRKHVTDEKAPKRGRKGRKTTPTETFSCPHCQKEYSSKLGFKYHIDNLVCRKKPKAPTNSSKQNQVGRTKGQESIDADHSKAKIDDNQVGGDSADEGNPLEEKSLTTASSNKADEENHKEDENEKNLEDHSPARPTSSSKKRKRRGTSSRFRGSLKDRTCPECNAVFTSAHGKNYHVMHSVCKKITMQSRDGEIAFPQLGRGEKFIHPVYGIVEVIADEREIATYQYPKDIRQNWREYQMYRDKQQVAKKNEYLNICFRSVLRRHKLSRVYNHDNVNQLTCYKAYFGRHLKQLQDKAIEIPPSKETPVDPIHVASAHPDRIVECKSIPDERRKIHSNDPSDRDSVDKDPRSSYIQLDQNSVFASKLYIRRRELKTVYRPDLDVYICSDCGVQFLSKDGFHYHVQGQVCVNKTKARREQQHEVQQKVYERLQRHLKRNRPKKKHRKAGVPVYPQVWLALGFQVAPKKAKTTTIEKTSVRDKGAQFDVEGQDKTLAEIAQEYNELLWKQGTSKFGSMYTTVFRSLGFQKPTIQKWKRKRKRAAAQSKEQPQSGKRLTTEPKKLLATESEKILTGNIEKSPTTGTEHQKEEDMEHVIAPVNKKPKLPIIDLQVLIDELKSGRYPSMRPYEGVYQDECAICKDGGNLLCCDFCPKVVHLECMCTKFDFTMPDEDFMCYKCAQTILSRRNRAEKRRMKKLQSVIEKDAKKGAKVVLEDGEDNGASQPETADQNEEPACPFECVAAAGKELSELLELLEEGQNRLIEVTNAGKFNDIKRAQIHGLVPNSLQHPRV